METNRTQTFDEAIKAKVEEYRSKFFEAVGLGIDKEFTWVDWLSNFKHNTGEEFQNLWELLKEAKLKYLRGINIDEILYKLAEEISIERSKQAIKSKLVYVTNNQEFHEFYTLEDMVEMGLNKELAEFLKSTNFDISTLNPKGRQSNGKHFNIDTHFLRERTVFNSYVEFQESFSYKYEFSTLEFINQIELNTISDFINFLEKYVKAIPLAQNELSSPFPIPLSSALQNFNVPEDFIRTEEILITYLAYQDFITEFPNEYVEKNGNLFLVGKSKEQFDKYFPDFIPVSELEVEWKGSKIQLMTLLRGLHEAKLLKGPWAGVLRTFGALLPNETWIEKSGPQNLASHIDNKRLSPQTEFKRLLTKIEKAFQSYSEAQKKETAQKRKVSEALIKQAKKNSEK